NEVLGLWLVGPFSGDFLIGLTNLPAVVLLVTAAMELAGQLGLGRPWDHLAGLTTAAAAPVLLQLASAGNDVAVAGPFLALPAYGVRYSRSGSRGDLAWAAISLGLLAGV